MINIIEIFKIYKYNNIQIYNNERSNMKQKKESCKMVSMKFRLYPSFSQIEMLESTFFVYNQTYNITIDFSHV